MKLDLGNKKIRETHTKAIEQIYEQGIKLGKEQAKEEIIKKIDEIDIELMFTDVKDDKGVMFSHSDEIMKIIEIWWDNKKEELKKEIK